MSLRDFLKAFHAHPVPVLVPCQCGKKQVYTHGGAVAVLHSDGSVEHHDEQACRTHPALPPHPSPEDRAYLASLPPWTRFVDPETGRAVKDAITEAARVHREDAEDDP